MLVMSVRLNAKTGKFSPLSPVKELKRLNEVFVDKMAELAVERMKDNTPSRTGRTRESTTAMKGERNMRSGAFEWFIGPTTEYAKFVNEGTRYIKPRRWIEKTAKELRGEIPQIAEGVFKGWENSWKWKAASESRVFVGSFDKVFGI